jgi:hypothetical protein
MSTRYFAFNTLAFGRRNTGTVVDGDTTAGRFDSSYVADCIKVPTESDYVEAAQPFIDGSTSLTGTFWLRFDTYLASYNGNAVDHVVFTMLNGTANAYRLKVNSGNMQVQYWNSGTSAWVNWGSSFSQWSATALVTVVFKLVVNSSFELYVGGSLQANSSTVPTNGASAVTTTRFTTVNANSFFSQIMGGDYDLRDSHLYSKLANGNGNYTAGTGTYTDINEAVLDDTTAISLPSIGNSKTFTKAAIAAIPSGYSIAGMVVNGRGRVGGGTITDGKFRVRSSSTDSDSAGKSYNGGYEGRGHFFATDPATATTWTKTGFDNAEFGAVAA